MFKLNFVTPEKRVVADAHLTELQLPAERGQLTILPGHARLMTILRPGILRYSLASGEVSEFVIDGGYCQVSPEEVSVMAERALTKEEVRLNATKIDQHLSDLNKRLESQSLSDVEWTESLKQRSWLESQKDFTSI